MNLFKGQTYRPQAVPTLGSICFGVLKTIIKKTMECIEMMVLHIPGIWFIVQELFLAFCLNIRVQDLGRMLG